jgi:large subunit ribosomal protein L22
MDLIRGRDVDDALNMLRFSKKRASVFVEKVIRSAVANANEQEVPTRNTLFVEKAWVDPGPIIKRFQPKDRGKAYPIQKKTSHLVVELGEREE